MSDETDPGFTITPAMSKKSRERAEKEAFENADKIMGEINEQTESESDPAYIDGTAEAPGKVPD